MYEKWIANQVKRNPKLFWNYVNSKMKYKEQVADLETSNGLLTDNKGKADELNKFFKSVFTEEDLSNMPAVDSREDIQSLKDIFFCEDDIRKLLKKLDKNKSMGPDEISPKLLLLIADSLVKPSYLIFRKSLDEGVLSQDWKEANITPIYKNKGSKHHTTNYRPVSLTSIIGKLMEKIVCKGIINHLRTNSIITDAQYGFLEKRSCSSNLMETLNEWTIAMDLKQEVDCIFLDFKKAFDSVPHQRLLMKMSMYGVKDKVIKWLRSFLIGRGQKVVVNNTESERMNVTSGVPQGSILGPVLFICYINDLPNEVVSKVKIFADDTKIYRSIKEDNDQISLQQDLLKLQDWAKTWQMKFHPDKCKLMTINGKESDRKYYMFDDDDEKVYLQKVDSEKDLGVNIDANLTFELQCQEAISKANKMLGIVRRSFMNMDIPMWRNLYTSLVRSKLEYAIEVWSPYLKRNIKALEKVQRRATKFIPSLQDLPYEERLKQLRLPSLEHRRKRGDMIQTYKYMSGLYHRNFLIISDERRTRGHERKLFKERCNSQIRSSFFVNRITEQWNNLPADIVMANNMNQFKNSIDAHWADDIYQFDE